MKQCETLRDDGAGGAGWCLWAGGAEVSAYTRTCWINKRKTERDELWCERIDVLIQGSRWRTREKSQRVTRRTLPKQQCTKKSSVSMLRKHLSLWATVKGQRSADQLNFRGFSSCIKLRAARLWLDNIHHCGTNPSTGYKYVRKTGNNLII